MSARSLGWDLRRKFSKVSLLEMIDQGGTCSCRHCIASAGKTGFDLEAATPVLKKDKNAQPERDNWFAFSLNEDTDCWRRRLFENIRVNHGDEIKLLGKADKNERAKRDYIEFIPAKNG